MFALLKLTVKLVCISSAFEKCLAAGELDGRRIEGRQEKYRRRGAGRKYAGWEGQARVKNLSRGPAWCKIFMCTMKNKLYYQMI